MKKNGKNGHDGNGKSVDKSGNGNLVHFQNGHDARRGRGPKPGAPNAGRPPSTWKQKCREAMDRFKVLDVAGEIIAGDILEEIGKDRNGEPIYGQTKNSDRLAAIKFLTEHGEGPPTQKVELDASHSFIAEVPPKLDAESWRRQFSQK